MPAPCVVPACATIDGQIYLAGGASGIVGNCAGAVTNRNLWVFNPQGGVTPQILGLKCGSANSVRLAWQGEAGRLYGVESMLDLSTGPRTRVMFSTGSPQ